MRQTKQLVILDAGVLTVQTLQAHNQRFQRAASGTFADAVDGDMRAECACLQSSDRRRNRKAEVLVEMRLDRLADAAEQLSDHVCRAFRRERAERIDQRHGIKVAACVQNAVEQRGQEIHIGTRSIRWEERDHQTELMRIPGCFGSGLDGLFHAPAHAALQHLLAAGNLDDNAVDAARLCNVHVAHHAADKAVDFRLQAERADFLDRRRVFLRRHRAARFNAVHTGRVQMLCDGDLVFPGKDDTRLLLTVAQRGVQNFNVLREMIILCNLRQIVCGADPPLAFFFISHFHASSLYFCPENRTDLQL